MPTARQIRTALPDEHVIRLLEVTARPYYWLDTTWVADDAEEVAAADGVVLRGINLAADAELAAVKITADQVREGYAKLLDLNQGFVRSDIHRDIITSWIDRDLVTPGEWGDRGQVELGVIDSVALDVIIQMAAFGSVIYG